MFYAKIQIIQILAVLVLVFASRVILRLCLVIRGHLRFALSLVEKIREFSLRGMSFALRASLELRLVILRLAFTVHYFFPQISTNCISNFHKLWTPFPALRSQLFLPAFLIENRKLIIGNCFTLVHHTLCRCCISDRRYKCVYLLV